jgi:hypothetical protein
MEMSRAVDQNSTSHHHLEIILLKIMVVILGTLFLPFLVESRHIPINKESQSNRINTLLAIGRDIQRIDLQCRVNMARLNITTHRGIKVRNKEYRFRDRLRVKILFHRRGQEVILLDGINRHRFPINKEILIGSRVVTVNLTPGHILD